MARPRPTRLVAEALEDRLLYAADSPMAVVALDAGLADHAPALTTASDAGASTATGRELVLIDRGLPDSATLLADLQAQRDAGRALDIVTFGAGDDGLAVLSQALATRDDVAAVHVISHGSDGVLWLGTARLDAATLMNRAGELAAWSEALRPDADLLLYGCDLAATDTGRALVADLAMLTGADVAASDDPTGAVERGGDWILEVQVGDVDHGPVMSAMAQAQWHERLATYVVTNTNDSGAGSLRAALTSANANAGADLIAFNIAGTGVHAITLASVLPTITGVVTIDASTDDSVAANGGRPAVELDGAAVTGAGLTFGSGSSGSLVRGLAIHSFSEAGIVISGGAANVSVLGNFLGTDASGVAAGLGNKWGIDAISAGAGLRLGSSAAGDGNVIVGNALGGIALNGPAVTATVQGNWIGVGADGVTALGNLGLSGYAGVTVLNQAQALIGGTGAGEGNVLAHNATGGVFVASNSTASILGNLIFDNGPLSTPPIDLTANSIYPDGPTANDTGDGDVGGNGLQNAPVLSRASIDGSSTAVSGTLNSTAGTPIRIEFFAGASETDARRFLGATEVTTGTGGNVSFTVQGLAAASLGETITATATRANAAFTTFTGTSELSAGVVVSNVAPVLDTTPILSLSVAENAPAPVGAVGTRVSALVDLPGGGGRDNITDTDLAPRTGIAVTSANAAEGQWWYTLDGGATWTAMTGIGKGNALLLAADADTRIFFRPVAAFDGTVPAALGFQAWDQTAGAPGGRINANTSGGGTSLSLATETLDVIVTPVNVAPGVSTSGGPASYVEGGAAVRVDSGLAVTDANGDTLAWATVTLANYVAGQDVLAYGGGHGVSGSWNAATGTLTLSGPANAGNFESALQEVTYRNTSQAPTAGTRTVQFVVNDGTVSSAVATQSVVVTAVADAPVVGGPTAVDVAENTAPSTVVATVSVSDVDSSTFTYALSGADASRFAIDTGGALRFVAAPDFEAPVDANGDNVYEVTVRVTDDTAATGTLALTVSVQDLGGPLVVTTTQDRVDGDVSSVEALLANRGADGKISLREAISAANHTAGQDQVVLGAGTYSITLNGAGENANAQGDFDLLDDLVLTGAGAESTILSGAGANAILHALAGTSSVSGLTLTNGYTLGTGRGAAVEVAAGASLSLSEVVVRDSVAGFGAHGGAIANAGSLTLTQVEVRDNTASGNGGALYHTGTSLTLDRVTLASNRATDGAGLYSTGGGVSLTNVTVSANQAVDQGGGLYLTSGAALVNVTLADNTAAEAGGVFAITTPVTLANVLVANSGGGSFNAAATLSSLGHNLSTDSPAQLNQPTDRVGAVAGLNALADNGGFARTHALAAGSAAINAGNDALAPAVDQTGAARQGIADIGATEYAGVLNTNPVNTVPGAVPPVPEDTGTPIVGVSVADADQGGGVAVFELGSVQLSVGSGTLAVTVSGGATLTAGSNGSATLTISGSQADLNATLATLRYTGNAQFSGADTLVVVSRDAAGASDTDTVALTVTPVNDAPTGGPAIDGEATEDQPLTANTTAIADIDGLGAFSYQWRRDGLDIAGATSATYVPGDADVGARITVAVSYVDGQGFNETLLSASVGPVASVNDPVAGAVSIGGGPVEDQVLTADPSALTDVDGLGAFGYQWQRNGVDVAGATSAAYTLGDADVGATMRVVVSYIDGQGTAEAVLSAAIGPIANANDLPVGAPAIVGTPTEDQVLRADASALTDADGLGAFSYQWLRNGVAIGGATGSTYTLGDADVGTRIRVAVSYTDGQGTAESLTSAAVGPVVNVNDAPQVTANALTLQGAAPAPLALSVSDPDSTPIDVLVTVVRATEGQFVLVADGTAVTAFTLDDVQAGRVVFVGSGTDATPIVELDVSDGASPAVRSLTTVQYTPPPSPPPAPEPPPSPVDSVDAGTVPVDAPPPVSAPAPAAAPAPAPAAPAPVVATPDEAPLPSEAATRTGAPAAADGATVAAVTLDGAVISVPRVIVGEIDIRPVSRIDPLAPLLEAEVQRFEGLPLSDFVRAVSSDDWQRRFDDVQREVRMPTFERRDVVSVATGVSSAFSVGYVIWLLRGGVLLSSLVSSLPAWHLIDPLPVLGRAGTDDDEDEEDVDRLFRRNRRAAPPPDASRETHSA